VWSVLVTGMMARLESGLQVIQVIQVIQQNLPDSHGEMQASPVQWAERDLAVRGRSRSRSSCVGVLRPMSMSRARTKARSGIWSPGRLVQSMWMLLHLVLRLRLKQVEPRGRWRLRMLPCYRFVDGWMRQFS
jgi:hypothetical protein